MDAPLGRERERATEVSPCFLFWPLLLHVDSLEETVRLSLPDLSEEAQEADASRLNGRRGRRADVTKRARACNFYPRTLSKQVQKTC